MAAPAKRPQPHHRSWVVRAIYQTAPIRDSACSHASYAMMLCGYPCSDTHGDPRNLTVCGSLFHLDIPSTTPSQPTRQPMRLLPWQRGRRCRTRQRAPERRRYRRRPAHAASTDATSMTIQASPRIPTPAATGEATTDAATPTAPRGAATGTTGAATAPPAGDTTTPARWRCRPARAESSTLSSNSPVCRDTIAAHVTAADTFAIVLGMPTMLLTGTSGTRSCTGRPTAVNTVVAVTIAVPGTPAVPIDDSSPITASAT